MIAGCTYDMYIKARIQNRNAVRRIWSKVEDIEEKKQWWEYYERWCDLVDDLCDRIHQ